MTTAEGFPVVTMSALLMTLSVSAIFLLYRHLKRLQAEHSHMLKLIRQAPVALFWFDRKGRLVGANERFLELSGYTIARLKGQLWTDRLLPSETALHLAHLLHRKDSNEVTAFSTPFIKVDGGWCRVELDIQMKDDLGIAVVREVH